MTKTETILLIEDNPADARLIVEMTQNCNFRFEIAERLSEGINRLKNSEYTAILLDLSLPDSQGFETITNALAAAPEIPIVILTGAGDDEIGLKAIQNGAQDYLVKGKISDDLLVRVLRYAIERNNLKNELEKIRLLHQQKELSDELKRNQSHLLAMSSGSGKLETQKHSASENLDLKPMVLIYKELVIKYIRALRLREERPSEEVREFAAMLNNHKVNAAGVVRIHLRFLNEISGQVDIQQERAFSNDARLVLVELLGNMLDYMLIKTVNDAK